MDFCILPQSVVAIISFKYQCTKRNDNLATCLSSSGQNGGIVCFSLMHKQCYLLSMFWMIPLWNPIKNQPMGHKRSYSQVWSRIHHDMNHREIQKLGSFLVVFLGSYLCQIMKGLNLISLVSLIFLVHVMIQKIQDLDRSGSRNWSRCTSC